MNGVKADTPEVPLAYDPQWEVWVKEVKRFEIGSDTTPVAPSLGYGWDKRNFFKFNIDPKIAQRAKEIVIIYSDNDHDSIQKAVLILKKEISGVKLRMIPKMGHFTEEDMNSSEFPELLEESLK